MKVIDEISRKFTLTESGQGSVEMKFAIYNKETQNVITPFCKCKDYFNDLFWTKYTKNDTIEQYGFTFRSGDDKGLLDEEYVTIAIRMNRRNSGTIEKLKEDNLQSILAILKKFEDANGFKPSTGEICEDGTHFIITFDRDWTSVPYVISTFFLLLRMGFNYDGQTGTKEYFSKVKSYITPNDQMYLKSTLNIVEDLEKGIIDKTQNWSDYKSCEEAHCYSGLVGYSNKYTKVKEVIKEAVAEIVN